MSNGGTTKVLPRTDLNVNEVNSDLALVKESVSLQQLVDGLNALGISPARPDRHPAGDQGLGRAAGRHRGAVMTATAPAAQAGHQLARLPAQLYKQAQDLEGVFLNTLMKEMFSSIKTDDASMGGGFGEETWRGMQAEQMANAVANQGGIGLAKQFMPHPARACRKPAQIATDHSNRGDSNMTAAERLAALDELPAAELIGVTEQTLQRTRRDHERGDHPAARRSSPRGRRSHGGKDAAGAGLCRAIRAPCSASSSGCKHEAPEPVARLRTGHESLATQLAENLRVIATARAVTEDLLTDVAQQRRQDQPPQSLRRERQISPPAASRGRHRHQPRPLTWPHLNQMHSQQRTSRQPPGA